jgi:hypothetical protein
MERFHYGPALTTKGGRPSKREYRSKVRQLPAPGISEGTAMENYAGIDAPLESAGGKCNAWCEFLWCYDAI